VLFSSYLVEVGQLVLQNTQTLFFIAAGNDYGLNLDENERWPATVDSTNKIVVAPLDVAKLKNEDLWKYQLADFSNFGPKKVDISTPGTDVLAWSIAHHKVPLSGTSMASPIACNIAVKIAESHESLSNEEIKEIMMKTVFIHDLRSPLPVRSGGIAIER
jgi:subtilisin family serine protease